jgi:GNAT superfamily N-acetyltransferase
MLHMQAAENSQHKIREINPNSEEEISLVAARMRQTLVEVLGEEKGTSLYSMEWLLGRVRWHLNSNLATAKIFLIEDDNCEIVGHAIARIDTDSDERRFGYFSTVFIVPAYRKKGLARSLLLHVEAWLRSMKMQKIAYNTAENHSQLINLFEKNGFAITHREGEMVQLSKHLS